MAYGFDYAFSPTGTASFWYSPAWITAMKAAGVEFVCRYTSTIASNDRNGKNLTADEAKALKAAGIKIVVVFETYAGRMRDGWAAGVADAQHSDAVVKALGMPGLPVYFAADWDAAPSEQTAINAYLDGAASVIGRARVGIYGGYYPVKKALDAGKAAYAWQTLAWSGGQWDARANIRQYLQIRVAGAYVDPNKTYKADYGQWPRPGNVPPADPYPILRQGDKGEAVITLQKRLNVWRPTYNRPPIAVDGDFGGETAGAVKEFQEIKFGPGPNVDGVVGPATWDILKTDPLPDGYWTFGPLRAFKVLGAVRDAVACEITSPDKFVGTLPANYVPGIHHYQVVVRRNDRTFVDCEIPKGEPVQTFQIDDLPPGTHLEIWVRARMEDGTHSSAWAKTDFYTVR